LDLNRDERTCGILAWQHAQISIHRLLFSGNHTSLNAIDSDANVVFISVVVVLPTPRLAIPHLCRRLIRDHAHHGHARHCAESVRLARSAHDRRQNPPNRDDRQRDATERVL
jgi:hypothetical protein